MEQTSGSKSYLISIVMVAVLGGLLFGYDTAVISGAEKGLQAFFLGGVGMASDAGSFIYTDGMHGFTCASALIGCVIGSALSGLLATRLGRKRSLILAGLLFFVSALGSMYPDIVQNGCRLKRETLLAHDVLCGGDGGGEVMYLDEMLYAARVASIISYHGSHQSR